MALTRQRRCLGYPSADPQGIRLLRQMFFLYMQEHVFPHSRWTFTGFSDSTESMINGRRSNVALTRQEDASIIPCDAPAIDDVKSELQRNVQTTEEIPPSEAESDFKIAEDSMDSIGKSQMLSSLFRGWRVGLRNSGGRDWR